MRSPDFASGTTPAWILSFWNRPWGWMALVAVLFCAPLFAGLDRTDVENDEAGYSFSVEKMLETGDWLTPRGIYDGVSPFLEKPPLKFWIVALPIDWGLLPASPFGLRFWDVFMGGVAFLYVFAIGRRLAGPVCGFVAVLLLFTHDALVFDHGLRTNNMEAPLVLQYAATVYHYLAWRSGSPDGRGHFVAIALYFVLGFMTKFVAALFAPVILAVAVSLSPHDRRQLIADWRGAVLASLLAAGLILPWFAYQHWIAGVDLFRLMVRDNVVTRFTAFLDPMHLRPWYFYFTELWHELGTPVTRGFVVLGAALLVARVFVRRWADGVIVILWFALPVVALSAGTSKLYHYFYPFLAPVALAGGYAAAAIALTVWRLLERPAEAMARARDAAWPALARRPWARVALTSSALAALAIAVVTHFEGTFRMTVGSVRFRNSSVGRPLVLATAALVAGASASSMRVIAAGAVVAATLPVAGYESALAETRRVNRPLADASACLTSEVSSGLAEGRTPPGVWVESRGFGHIFYYYLRRLGVWQARGVASDSTVAAHLFAPVMYRPVLLSRQRFDEFWVNLTRNEADLLAAAARKAEVDPDRLRELSRHTAISRVDFPMEVLLLPGPYAHCGSDYIRSPAAGGK